MRKSLLCIIFALILLTPIFAQDSRALEIALKELAGEDTIVGKQYAVFIAVDRYAHWLPLKNPVKDAQEIRDIITRRYYVDEVLELFDEQATKAEISRLFAKLIEETLPEDSVFIFYAGHGHLDQFSNNGFWIPVDGGTDKFAQENWLSNNVIRGYISNLKARRVVIFVDSCFSGDILNPTRGAPEITDVYFQNAYNRVSRQVLTSGASETVPDVSEFAQQLKLALDGNTHPYVDPLMIYNDIRLGITRTTPLFGNLQGSGHQDGASFLFFRKTDDTPAVATALSPKQITVVKDLGTLKISTYDAGELYLEGRYLTDIGRDRSVTLPDIEAGPYELEMRFPGHTESQEIVLEKDKLMEVPFTYEANPVFTLVVDPGKADLSVHVDGRHVGNTPIELEVQAGERLVSIHAKWIEAIEETITGESRQIHRFEPQIVELGGLRTSYRFPTGAAIKVDGTAYSISTLSAADGLMLPVGEHLVHIEHETIKPYSTVVYVEAGRNVSFSPELAFRTGGLRIPGLPAWAGAVIIDDTTHRRSGDVQNSELVIGTRTVIIPNPFGNSYSISAVVREGETTTITVPFGNLEVRGLPADMTITLGNRVVSAQYLEMFDDGLRIRNLMPGPYKAIAEGADVDTTIFSIVISPNSITRKTVSVREYGYLDIIGPSGGKTVTASAVSSDGKMLTVSLGTTKIPAGHYEVSAAFSDDIDTAFLVPMRIGRGDKKRIDLSRLTYSKAFAEYSQLRDQQNMLEQQLDEITAKRRTYTISGWISLSAGMIGAIGSIVSFSYGQNAMEEYNNSVGVSSAAAARAIVELWGNLFAAFSTVGGAGTSLGSLLLLLRPTGKDLEQHIAEIDTQMIIVKGGGN